MAGVADYQSASCQHRAMWDIAAEVYVVRHLTEELYAKVGDGMKG
jgi:hypothetical protein